jgi:hypothetical protein
MRLRCGAATAVLLAVVGSAAPAWAQHVEYKASITLTGAYTRSYSDYPYPTAQTFTVPTISLSPSLITLIDTMRTENTLSYTFSLSAPVFAHTSVPQPPLTYSNRLSYAGHYALSEVTSMTLGAGFIEAPINTFVPSQDPTAAPIEAVPGGDAVQLTANANEGFARLLNDTTSFSQAGAFTYSKPIDPSSVRSDTYSATNSFGITKSFFHDAVGVTLSNQFNYFSASQVSVVSTVVEPGTAWVNTLALNWMHPFSESFSGAISAGVTQTIIPDTLQYMVWQPTGTATLNYTFRLATAALAYSHQAQPNLSIGTINFSDMASLRFAMPIGVTGFIATGTAGYTHSSPVGTPKVITPLTGPTDVFLGDVALDYHPERVPTLTVGLRGQLTRQIVSLDITNTFTRYTVALNLTYSYPNANAAATRPRLSPLYSVQPPSTSDIVSTDRFFSSPVSGAAPAVPLPLPKGP